MFNYENDRQNVLVLLYDKSQKKAFFSTKKARESFKQAVTDCRTAVAACTPYAFNYDNLQQTMSKVRAGWHVEDLEAYYAGKMAAKSVLSVYYHNKYDKT